MKHFARTLLLTDHLNSACWSKDLSQAKVCDLHILLFQYTPQSFRSDNHDYLAKLRSYEFVDYSDIAKEIQGEIRSFLPKCIHDLARQKICDGKALIEFFSWNQTNLWWYLNLCEKSALKLKVIHQLFYLGVVGKILETQKYETLWICVEDDLLADAVRKNFANKVKVVVCSGKGKSKCAPRHTIKRILARFFVINFSLRLARECLEVLFRFLLIRLLRIRNSWTTLKYETGIFTHYPLWWSQPFSINSSEMFFGSIARKLREKGAVIFIAWCMASPWILIRRRNEIIRTLNHHNILPLERALFLKDIVSIMFLSSLVRTVMNCFKLVKNYTTASFLGFDISNLLIKEIERSFTNRDFFNSILIERAVSRIMDKGVAKIILIRNEFQPCEKAVVTACRGRAVTIGFQHAFIGRNHLPYYFASGEIDGSQDLRYSQERMPLPNYFILSGDFAAQLWEQNGFSRNLFRVSGPARFSGLHQSALSFGEREAGRLAENLPTDRLIIFVSLSIVWREVFNLMHLLLDAMDDSLRSKCFLIFKNHPGATFDSKSKYFDRYLQDVQYRLIPSGVDALRFVKLSDAILSSGSTACVEAITQGVVPIVFHDFSRFSVDPMLELEDASIQVRNSHDLNDTLHLLAQGNQFLDKRSNWKKAVKLAFHDVDRDPVDQFSVIFEKFKKSSIC